LDEALVVKVSGLLSLELLAKNPGTPGLGVSWHLEKFISVLGVHPGILDPSFEVVLLNPELGEQVSPPQQLLFGAGLRERERERERGKVSSHFGGRREEGGGRPYMEGSLFALRLSPSSLIFATNCTSFFLAASSSSELPSPDCSVFS